MIAHNPDTFPAPANTWQTTENSSIRDNFSKWATLSCGFDNFNNDAASSDYKDIIFTGEYG